MRNLTTVRYRAWCKAVRKYRKLQQRSQHESSTRWSAKLDQLRRRIVRMNRRWQVGVAAGALAAWLAIPAGAQAQEFPARINVNTLDSTRGFVVNEVDEDDFFGSAVGEAGDVNGDGFDDIIVGARLANPFTNGRSSPSDAGDEAGESYVVFGSSDPMDLDAANLDGTNGFTIAQTPNENRSFDDDLLGISVSGIGDVNADGLDDVVVGAYRAGAGDDRNAGESYVVFGRNEGFDARVDPATLDGSNGFVITGIDREDLAGSSVSEAGDVNGDGLDDFIVGAQGVNPDTVNFGFLSIGASYVIFGSNSDFSDTLSLATLDGSNGFAIQGANIRYGTGTAVGEAGDVNGDGFDDVVIGASYASPDSIENAGASYVIFGSDSPEARLNLATLDSSEGFAVLGTVAGGRLGDAVGGGGDINADGLDDVILGARRATVSDSSDVGESYIIFGATDGFGAQFDLATLDGSNGFVVRGENTGDRLGNAVSIVGDINADGVDDLLIGAYGANRSAGEAYVIFGDSDAFDPTFDLSTLDGDRGFVLETNQTNSLGGATDAAGDVNGDGIDDLVVGAYAGDSAKVYVVFGQGDMTEAPDSSSVISSLSLVRADDDQVLGTLTNGDVLEAATFGPEGFDVEAVTEGDRVARIDFKIQKPDGSVVQRTEQVAPYVLFGHLGSDFNGMEAVPGAYALAVTPFLVGDNGQEVQGEIVVANFSITGEAASLTAFPNRFDNELTVQTDQLAADVQLRLQSVTDGRTHVMGADKLSQGADGLRIDTQGLPAGHYILQLTNPKQTRTLHVVKE